MDWAELTEGAMSVCRDTFGEPILYVPTGQAGFETQGIFDDEYREVQLLDGSSVQSVTPRLGMCRSDLLGRTVKKGDRAVVRGTNYRVIDFQPDGQAGCVLFLEKVQP